MLKFPDAEGLRPTPGRVRQTVFNWLGQDLTGKICLDLFAGTGAMGFEALSRNAKNVTMVENSSLAFKSLKQNQELLKAPKLPNFEYRRATIFSVKYAKIRCDFL